MSGDWSVRATGGAAALCLICIPLGIDSCTAFTVSPGTRVGRDVEFGVLGGFWH